MTTPTDCDPGPVLGRSGEMRWFQIFLVFKIGNRAGRFENPNKRLRGLAGL